MPLFSDKFIVGGVASPTTTVENKPTEPDKNNIFEKLKAKPPEVKQEKPVDQNVNSFQKIREEAYKQKPTITRTPKPIVEEPKVEENRYVKKEDGELIRHINKKSTYLRDIFEIDL